MALGWPVAARGELPLRISFSVSATHSDMRGRVAGLFRNTHRRCLPLGNLHTCTLTHGFVIRLLGHLILQQLLLRAKHMMRTAAGASQHSLSVHLDNCVLKLSFFLSVPCAWLPNGGVDVSPEVTQTEKV